MAVEVTNHATTTDLLQTDIESLPELTLADQSKLGTTLDGARKFKDSSIKLNKNEHVVQLGNYAQKFR